MECRKQCAQKTVCNHIDTQLFMSLSIGCAAMVAASWLATVEIDIAAVSSREQVAPNSDRSWAPPNLPQYENALRKGSAAALDKGKELARLRLRPARCKGSKVARGAAPVGRNGIA